MAHCAKCKEAKFTARPCPHCGELANVPSDPMFIVGHLTDLADMCYRTDPETGEFAKIENP